MISEQLLILQKTNSEGRYFAMLKRRAHSSLIRSIKMFYGKGEPFDTSKRSMCKLCLMNSGPVGILFKLLKAFAVHETCDKNRRKLIRSCVLATLLRLIIILEGFVCLKSYVLYHCKSFCSSQQSIHQ